MGSIDERDENFGLVLWSLNSDGPLRQDGRGFCLLLNLTRIWMLGIKEPIGMTPSGKDGHPPSTTARLKTLLSNALFLCGLGKA